MAGERVQTQDLKTSSPLAPVARPVDSYVRPTAASVGPAAPSELEDLARQLNIVAPQLQQNLAESHKQYTEAEIKAGTEARLKNQKSFRDAVQSGVIPEAANPWFVKGYQQQDGRLSAMEFDAAMRTAWASSPVKESDNPAEFTKFLADFRKSWMQDHEGGTQDWMDGFIPGLHQSESNMTAQHIAHRQAEISRAVRENTANEIGVLLNNQEQRERGMSPLDPLVQESRMATAREIQNRTKDLVQKGLSGSDANKITAEVVIAKGIELKDGDYARAILSNIQTPGGNVAGIADVAQKLNSAETLISNQKWNDRMHAEHDEDRPFAVASRNFGLLQIQHTKDQWAKEKVSYDRTERVRGMTNEMTMKVLAGQPIDPKEYQALAKDDASAAAWVKNFRHTLLTQNAQIISDQGEVSRTMLVIATNPENVTARDIFSGVQQGKWDMGMAMTMWNERQQMLSPGQDPANRDPYFGGLLNGLVGGISGNVARVSGEAQFDASNAGVEFRKYQRELMADPKLTPSERMEKLRTKQLDLMMHYNKIGAERSKVAEDAGVVKPSTIRGETNKKSDGPLPIPPAAVQHLMQHPELQAEFEKKYNLVPGSASTLINRK